jgi:hypothetical protein
MIYGIYRVGGWIELAFAVVLLLGRDWPWAIAHLVVSAFLLPVGYRVYAIGGVRIPWVKDNGAK